MNGRVQKTSRGANRLSLSAGTTKARRPRPLASYRRGDVGRVPYEFPRLCVRDANRERGLRTVLTVKILTVRVLTKVGMNRPAGSERLVSVFHQRKNRSW